LARRSDFETDPTLFEDLHRDELEYHSRVRPHEKADLVLLRVELPPPLGL